jgi:hypothetical protein
MSAAQLGVDSMEVEQNLSDILEMTTKWKSVLLLDECEGCPTYSPLSDTKH